MADIDKEGLMNMLGGLLGEDKKGAVESIMNSVGNDSQGSGSPNNADAINTAELMTKMTRIMDKLNRTKDNREFALLSAIRPYVRDQRKNKVDTCLKMLQVVNVMNEIKKEG